jgi:uncharacterized protein YwqG
MDDFEPTALCADAIVLVPNACRDSQIDKGLSKFGGNPDLPEDFKLNFDYQYFVGQINFAQINGRGNFQLLPQVGILSIFLSLSPDQSCIAKVKYLASTDSLQRILLPPKKHPCHPCRLTPYPMQSMSAHDAANDDYMRYQNQFLQRFYPHKQKLDFDTPWHQMLGFSRNNARSEQKPETHRDRILLLQVDSDSLVSMSWGYNGNLYFWISQSDLEAKNFANVEVELAEAQKVF